MEEVVKVLEFGATKYDADNWKKLSKADYVDPALRHIMYFLKNDHEKNLAPDSGLHHIAHAITDLLFILWFEMDREDCRVDFSELKEKWSEYTSTLDKESFFKKD